MGCRSSSSKFDMLPVALEWICINNFNVNYLCHLLDDFLAVEPPAEKGKSLREILHVFDKLGIPVANDKVEGPVTTLEFLGITLDTILFEARLSQEKVTKLKDQVQEFIYRKKCSNRDISSLIGSLSFACKVIVPGRSFLSRFINLSCTVKKTTITNEFNKFFSTVASNLKAKSIILKDFIWSPRTKVSIVSPNQFRLRLFTTDSVY